LRKPFTDLSRPKDRQGQSWFNNHDAYTLLKLQNSAGGSGVKAFASFNVDEATEVDRLTPIAIAKGAVLRSSRQLVPDQFGPA
jgi:hypothetical protein